MSVIIKFRLAETINTQYTCISDCVGDHGSSSQVKLDEVISLCNLKYQCKRKQTLIDSPSIGTKYIAGGQILFGECE